MKNQQDLAKDKDEKGEQEEGAEEKYQRAGAVDRTDGRSVGGLVVGRQRLVSHFVEFCRVKKARSVGAPLAADMMYSAALFRAGDDAANGAIVCRGGDGDADAAPTTTITTITTGRGSCSVWQ